MQALKFETGDPVWVAQYDRDIRAYVAGWRKDDEVVIEMKSGKKAAVPPSRLKYRYEKGEF